jgi:O-methyltransferase involved in polyketide biosynthesis
VGEFMELRNESKTLFIPLFGKAEMSKKKLFLKDSKAEEIISKVDYAFDSLKQSKWLSMYMSLRAAIIDELVNEYLLNHQDAVVVHLGCGLDSRCLRVNGRFYKWYDVDYENVIDIRREFYNVNDNYVMIGSSVTDFKWLEQIETKENVLIVMEGLTMYLANGEIKKLLQDINVKFKKVHLLFDAYSRRGVKLSKIKNPVNQVGAEIKYGFNSVGEFLKMNDNLNFCKTHFIKKKNNGLKGLTKLIFNNLYCGKISRSLYKIYEFKLQDKEIREKV